MFALSASSSATRVAVSARAPAQRTTAAAAFATPTTASSAASRVTLKTRVNGAAALKASSSSVAAKASARGANLSVFAGRFESERTYIMIKPDGVQRGYVSCCSMNTPTTTRHASPKKKKKKQSAFSSLSKPKTDVEQLFGVCTECIVFLYHFLLSVCASNDDNGQRRGDA